MSGPNIRQSGFIEKNQKLKTLFDNSRSGGSDGRGGYSSDREAGGRL
jgi:hypothetical protein